MSFDWTINISHIISFVGFVIGGLIVVFTLRLEIRMMALRIKGLEAVVMTMQEGMKQLVVVMVEQARHEVRVDGLEKRIDELWQDRIK